jgi:hypothetical protein
MAQAGGPVQPATRGLSANPPPPSKVVSRSMYSCTVSHRDPVPVVQPC